MNQTQLGSFEFIPLSAISLSPTNPRKHIDPIKLAELTRSVEELGVQQPVLLRPSPSGYELVYGERRYLAAGAAGKDSVPAIVRELTDVEVREIQLVENLQRADLHPIEEAGAYKVLLAGGATIEDLAKKAGKDVPYVTKRVELLKLSPEANTIFSEQHITLSHALELARLTWENQAKALCFLLGIPEWQIKKDNTHAQAAAAKVENYTGLTWMKTADDRLVRPTAAQLIDWIKSNVLLVLKSAPWDLGDAGLVPEAGACTTCPKRTGANQALFSDLTTAADNCTDSVCFSAKQKAFVAYTQETAKDTGSPLLKLSSKHSADKMEVAPVELKPAGMKLKGKLGEGAVPIVKPVVVAKKTIREGQWVEAKKGSCPMVVQGVLTDGKDMGKTRYVCTDQACKVHHHVVNKPAPKAAGKPSPETAKKAEAERALKEKIEEQGDEQIMAALRSDRQDKHRYVERALLAELDYQGGGDLVGNVCGALSLSVKGWKPGTKIGWDKQEAAMKVIGEHLLKKATPADLSAVALELLINQKMEDSDIDSLAEIAGVDANSIRDRVEQELRAETTPKPATAKTTAKKSASKKLSPESKQRIVDAMKARWSKTDANAHDEELQEALDEDPEDADKYEQSDDEDAEDE